jgi:hypothetical protein
MIMTALEFIYMYIQLYDTILIVLHAYINYNALNTGGKGKDNWWLTTHSQSDAESIYIYFYDTNATFNTQNTRLKHEEKW